VQGLRVNLVANELRLPEQLMTPALMQLLVSIAFCKCRQVSSIFVSRPFWHWAILSASYNHIP